MSRNKDKGIQGSKVIVGDLPLQVALRKFKQRVDDSGKLEELKARSHFEKPTTERKRKKGAARARWLKKIRDNELPKKLF
jgi:small subunit ribosomal protein S21